MMNEITIIGIAGASGAGKSSLAHTVVNRLQKRYGEDQVVLLHEDAYYRSRDDLTFEQREQINYDHPDALEHSLMLEHLNALRQGHIVNVPQYDYATHNRLPSTDTLAPPLVLVVEGILILHDPEIRSQLDLRLFVDVPLDICLARRIERDVNQRGRTVDSVLEQFRNTVRPMYFQYIEPTRQQADMIVPEGGENEKAVEVLISHLQKLLD